MQIQFCNMSLNCPKPLWLGSVKGGTNTVWHADGAVVMALLT